MDGALRGSDVNIVIRVDSSISIGSGHVMRCLALAAEMTLCDHSVVFICADFRGHLATLIKKQGCQVVLLPRKQEDVSADHMGNWLGCKWEIDVEQCRQALNDVEKIDWLIVDHYAIDARWECAMAPCCESILVIDDLANRPHQCDLLLDQTLNRRAFDYSPWLKNKNTEMLLGSQFSLLRPEFSAQRGRALAARSQRCRVSKILLTMGGMDLDNISEMVLDALALVTEPSWRVTVVLGSGAPHYQSIQEKITQYNFEVELLTSIDNMAHLMAEADLAIGAAGTTSWERCSLGLPTILIQTADNQRLVAKELSSQGAVIFIGEGKQLKSKIILEALAYAENNLSALSSATSSICDGKGAKRVANYIYLGKRIILRAVTELDVDLIFQWQSEREARRYSRNTATPSYEQHTAWVAKRLSSSDPYLIIVFDDQPVGVLRLDKLVLDNEYEVSILISFNYYGQGIGTEALTKLRRQYPSVTIVAEVHEDNLPSSALFKKLGYEQLNGKYYSYSDFSNEA